MLPVPDQPFLCIPTRLFQKGGCKHNLLFSSTILRRDTVPPVRVQQLSPFSLHEVEAPGTFQATEIFTRLQQLKWWLRKIIPVAWETLEIKRQSGFWAHDFLALPGLHFQSSCTCIVYKSYFWYLVLSSSLQIFRVKRKGDKLQWTQAVLQYWSLSH